MNNKPYLHHFLLFSYPSDFTFNHSLKAFMSVKGSP